MSTCTSSEKLLPLMVTSLPPAKDPTLGEAEPNNMLVLTVSPYGAYPFPATFKSTLFVPATGVTVHVSCVADAVCTAHAALPIVTVLSEVFVLNPVPTMVSVPAELSEDGLTLVTVGVWESWKLKEQVTSSSGHENREIVDVTTPSSCTVCTYF